MSDIIKGTQRPDVGQIIKAVAGFYYVESGGSLLQCRARGIFRKNGENPLAGDFVRFSRSESQGDGSVEEILERKNHLTRPPVANLDKLFLVASAANPTVDLRLLDKMIAIAEFKDIEPILLFTKPDLRDVAEYVAIYKKSGFHAYSVCATKGEGVEQVIGEIKGALGAFCGNSGVGKTTILSAIAPELTLETAEISEKLGRGRHTTRVTEIYSIHGGQIADTPGFSSVDLIRYERITAAGLPESFREFRKYSDKCRFNTCKHLVEPACAVRAAVESGKIPQSRYDSYVSIFDEIKDLKEWQLKKEP